MIRVPAQSWSHSFLEDGRERRGRVGEVRELVEDEEERVVSGALGHEREEVLPRGEPRAAPEGRVAEVLADDPAEAGELLGLRSARRLVVDAADGAGEPGEHVALADAAATDGEGEVGAGPRPELSEGGPFRVAVDDVGGLLDHAGRYVPLVEVSRMVLPIHSFLSAPDQTWASGV